MKVINMDAKLLVKYHEGTKLFPYRDTVGILTIGHGRNLQQNGISAQEADYLLQNDLDRCQKELNDKLPWFNTLNEPRKGVLIDMCFQLGINGLLKFKNSLELIKNGDWDKAADSLKLSLWAKQVPTRCILNANIIKTGEWPTELN